MDLVLSNLQRLICHKTQIDMTYYITYVLPDNVLPDIAYILLDPVLHYKRIARSRITYILLDPVLYCVPTTKFPRRLGL